MAGSNISRAGFEDTARTETKGFRRADSSLYICRGSTSHRRYPGHEEQDITRRERWRHCEAIR